MRGSQLDIKTSIPVHFNRSNIFLLFLKRILRQSVRKKVNKYLVEYISVEFHHSTEAATWVVLHKKVFLKFLQYSQENPCVGVSLQAFSPAILFIRDTNNYVFLSIFQTFTKHLFWRNLRTNFFIKRVDKAED